MSRDDKLQWYRWTQEDLLVKGVRATLVGSSRKHRPCPDCHKPILPGTPVINYGKIADRWRWICVACAPDNPLQLPHVKDVLGDVLGVCNCGDLFIRDGDIDQCPSCYESDRFWLEGCTGRWEGRSCPEVSCCGFCRDGGGEFNYCNIDEDSEECEECVEYLGLPKGAEVCCGGCEGCSSGGGLPLGEWCEYCQLSDSLVSAWIGDDYAQIQQARRELTAAQETIQKAEEELVAAQKAAQEAEETISYYKADIEKVEARH
jgi:hypothetical protein